MRSRLPCREPWISEAEGGGRESKGVAWWREGGPQLLVGLQQPTSSRNIFCLSSTWAILGNFGHFWALGHFWARSRMGCLSILVLVASLLAVQVRFVTGCSIKGEVQCNEMFPFLQNVNNNFLPLLSWRLLTRKYWFCWFLWWESYDSLSFISFQLDIRNLMGQGKVPRPIYHNWW